MAHHDGVALAVCLLFDRRTERRLVALWESLEDLGVASLLSHTHGRHVPHLSYAVLRTFDVDAVHRAVTALPPQAPFSLHFDAVSFFRRGRAALVPAVSSDLIARQARVITAVRGTGAGLHIHYRPEFWLPHCSIATRVRRDQAGEVAAATYDVLPIDAVADRTVLIDSSTGEHWALPGVI